MEGKRRYAVCHRCGVLFGPAGVQLSLPTPPQVHPVVSRLCAPIEGTDGAHIADCLGLDPARFRGSGGAAGGSGGGASDEYAGCASALDDEANFVVSGKGSGAGGSRAERGGRSGVEGGTPDASMHFALMR